MHDWVEIAGAHSLSGERSEARAAISPRELIARRGPVVAGYALPFLLVLYLALKGGGYDSVVRGEVGIAIWWVILLGAAVGVLPILRLGRAAWLGLALLLGFCAWTAFSTGWSESSERSVAELGRLAAYLGVFVLALTAQGRDGLRRTVYAVGGACAVVALMALASRLHPAWFPANEAGRFLTEAGRRLNYPVNYWNGLAALIAVALPLVLWIAAEARHLLTRALAAAAIPAMCLAGFYTLSRGGALEVMVAIAALLALYPRRLSLLPTLLVAGAGSVIAVAAATQRDALADGFTTPAAAAQADQMLAIVLVVGVGVGLLQTAIGLLAHYDLGPRPRISRRASAIAVITTCVVGVVASIAVGVPGELSDRWQEFKQPVLANDPTQTNGVDRFESASGNGRYQYWQSALDASATEPLTGIGAGTFEFWWSREGTIPGFVRDAHSLYLETLAELGIVGLALIACLILLPLGVGIRSAFTADPQRRALAAAATASCLAFATAAAVDWVWEIAVLPIIFLLLAAALIGERTASTGSRTRPRGRGRLATGLGLIVLSIAAIAAIAVPLAGTVSVRESQDQVKEARLTDALDTAEGAQRLQPYAATPSLQEALVLELSGDLEGATAAATKATEDEATNWRTWFVLSRLQARLGNVDAAIANYRKARSLNPRSPLFRS